MSGPAVLVEQLRGLLTPLAEVTGMVALAVLDPVTATPLISQQFDELMSRSEAAGSAAGLVDAYRLMDVATSSTLPTSEVEDVVITLSHHYQLVRRFQLSREQHLLVVVLLTKEDTNLAMALRILRRLPLPLPELLSASRPSPPDRRGSASEVFPW